MLSTIIEKLVLPAPTCTYTTDTPYLKIIDDVAMMHYVVNNEKTTIIYSHGNGMDIGQSNIVLAEMALQLNINIITYDYEGYGLSQGWRSEAGCNRAIQKVYDYLKSKEITSNNIILYGVSIGTAPSIDLAYKLHKTINFKAILLQAPFTSIIAVAFPRLANATSYMGFLNPDTFMNYKKIGYIKSPITILHGKKDSLVTHDHAVKLCEINNKINLISFENASHHNIEQLHFQEVMDILNSLSIDWKN